MSDSRKNNKEAPPPPEDDVPPPPAEGETSHLPHTPHPSHSSNAVIAGAMHAPVASTAASPPAPPALPSHPPPATLKIAMISWNMANEYGGDIAKLMEAIKIKKPGVADCYPDIIVIAGQEEGRVDNLSLGSQIQQALGVNSYQRQCESFDTRTKLPTMSDLRKGDLRRGEGRVSLTVLSRSGLTPPPKLDRQMEVTQGGKIYPAANKGGVSCHLTVGDQKFSFTGVHLDSNYDHLKVEAAKTMVEKLEGFGEGNYLSYETMKSRSTDVDIMMGDFNHRDVEIKGSADHLDPLAPKNVASSSARYVTGLSYASVEFKEEKKGEPAPKTYSKEKNVLIPNKKGKRCEGGTGNSCYSEGTLDRICASYKRGKAKLTPVVMVESHASDHKPIVSIMTVPTVAQTDFVRTKNWVMRKIQDYASQGVLDVLEKTQDDANGRQHLEAVFNYYMSVRSLALEAEKFRLQPRLKGKEDGVAEYWALMGGWKDQELGYRKTFKETVQTVLVGRPGLVQKMIKEGDKVFSSKERLDTTIIDNLQKKVTKEIDKADKDGGKNLDTCTTRARKVMADMVASQKKSSQERKDSEKSPPVQSPTSKGSSRPSAHR